MTLDKSLELGARPKVGRPKPGLRIRLILAGDCPYADVGLRVGLYETSVVRRPRAVHARTQEARIEAVAILHTPGSSSGLVRAATASKGQSGCHVATLPPRGNPTARGNRYAVCPGFEPPPYGILAWDVLWIVLPAHLVGEREALFKGVRRVARARLALRVVLARCGVDDGT